MQRISRCVINWPSSTGKFIGRNCIGGIDSSGRLSQIWKNQREALIIGCVGASIEGKGEDKPFSVRALTFSCALSGILAVRSPTESLAP